ncbi:MAG: 6-bladed beta-propeller [Candidatus Hodarchaeota archaeon]
MKSKNFIFSIALLLSIFIILVSCGKQKTEWQGTIEEVDGVTVVTNPKEPMYGEKIFEIEEELSIGVAEGAEEYMFQDAREVVVDNSERIFVSDFRNVHIRVFDRFGNYVTTIGRKGQGPGEFGQITNIQITPRDELMVHDRYTRRLSFFSLDGDYLRMEQLKEIQAGRVKVDSKSNYFVRTYDFEEGTFNAAVELKKYGPNFEFLDTIAKDKYRSIQVPLQPGMASKFLPSDSIVCGFRESYEFQILDSEGNVIQRVSKDYIPVEISEEEKAIRHLPQSNELPSLFPAFQDFSVDEEGRIYAQTFERQWAGDKFYYDVFDSNGKYICKVQLNSLPRYWKNKKMYTTEEDENGYQYVKRYKVTWKI